MDDDEELEEEEEGMDEEDEEEEVSDYADEEFYDGEEYEDFDDEEGEEEEDEEEDEDGDIPPLEGVEEKAGEMGMEEGKVLQAAVEEGEMAGLSMEGDSEGGIEEVQTNRAQFGEDRMNVQEVESIGVLEEAREGEGDEDECERMDDPTMPQILCVTGGALEERDETEEEGARSGGGEVQEEASSWQQGASETEATASSEDHTKSQSKEVANSVLRSHFSV